MIYQFIDTNSSLECNRIEAYNNVLVLFMDDVKIGMTKLNDDYKLKYLKEFSNKDKKVYGFRNVK